MTMSLSLGADHRDHPTTPRMGHTMFTTLEIGGLGAIGLAQYTRLQLLLLGFMPIHPRAVLAGKLRLGTIWWRNREKSYVPYDRHFFAGGANSIRGWASRSLWDPSSGGIGTSAGYSLASYIGGALLIEGSGEFRLRFPPLRLGSLTPYTENLVLIGFLDWGNAYNRLTPELYGKATANTIVSNMAISAGMGLGYLTDVGPIRIDAAIRLHDPLDPSAPWIFHRSAALRRWTLHIGLGYAF
ncbi:MAG: BamA/TamA family outer membrane protein [Bacteroidota bacterium]|nr:BamA/TamA family outer membrane protein [Bacteroidota bacterium]